MSDQVLPYLNSTREGLDEEEVSHGQKIHGKNELRKTPKSHTIAIFAKQFVSPLILMLATLGFVHKVATMAIIALRRTSNARLLQEAAEGVQGT